MGLEKSRKVLVWLASFLASAITFGWTIITYVVPDPTILGFDVINWKNILLFSCFLIGSTWLLIYFWLQRLPTIARHLLAVTAYAVSAALFFALGIKYQDPLFGVSKSEAVYAYNDSSTLLGERVESIDGVSVLLRGCQKSIGQIACKVELLNKGPDREIAFHGDTRAFDDASNEMELTSLVIGTSFHRTSKDFSLPKGVKTTIVVAFNSANNSIKSLTSLRLRFSGMDGPRKGVKFDSVPLI